MIKFLLKKWSLVAGLLLMGVYLYGYQKMFFHQDDLDWFLLAHKPFWQVMSAPIGDHVNYLFRILLKIEWNVFHLYFPGYLFVSCVMHAIVVWLVYILAATTSERKDLAALSALLFTINTNWTEVVLWTSGQTISITVIFVLIAMLAIWKHRYEAIALSGACLTSALALGLPVAALWVYGFVPKKGLTKVGYGALSAMILVFVIILWKRSDGTAITFSLSWAVRVIEVWGLAMLNTVVGRLLIPFDYFERVRIGIVSLLGLIGLWKWREGISGIWKDSWSRFLIIQLGVYYLVVAVGRAQYGVGIMRAERYAYLGLALFLLLAVRVLRKMKLERWVWLVPVIVIIQSVGLYRRANDYVIRPQQLKNLFGELKSVDQSRIDQDDFLPHFVLNDERLKYSDLMMLIND